MTASYTRRVGRAGVFTSVGDIEREEQAHE